MKIKDIFKPIDKELNMIVAELDNLASYAGFPSITQIYKHFFGKSGKHLRPALTFLTAGAIRGKETDKVDEKLIKLALVLELLHSASLVHDDIIDEDLTRRGQDTLNNTFGNKIAVLAGDTLFTSAFALVSSEFSKEYSQSVTDLAFKMCVGEIEQAKGIDSRDKYFAVIKGKTALFTSVCCKLGATYAGASEEDITNLENFGLYLGIAYQIKDDYTDKDPNALKFVTLEDAKIYNDKAMQCLENLNDSVYRRSLSDLMYYIMNVSYS